MLPSLIYMKLGFCHLGFRVCSVRHVWYVTKRPSKEEAAEGDSHPHQQNGACATSWGVRPPHCALIIGSCVQPERHPPPQGMLGCYDLFLEACVHPEPHPPLPTRGVGGCSVTKASSLPIPWSFRGPTCSQVCVRKRLRLRNCLWPDLGTLWNDSLPIEASAHPLIYQEMPLAFWFWLVSNCQNLLPRLQGFQEARLMNLFRVQKVASPDPRNL